MSGDGTDSIAGLMFRAVDEAGAVVRAEIAVYRQTALARLAQSRTGLIFAVVGIGLTLSSMVALIVGLVLGLAALIGGVFAGLIVCIGTLLIAYLFIRLALTRLLGKNGPTA